MISKVGKLLQERNAATLKELSEKLNVSSDIVKNVSSGRTAYSSLFKRKYRQRADPGPSEDLAELIGIVLGDGNIFEFDRCQRLTISCNSSYAAYTQHVKRLVSRVFQKEPSIVKRSRTKCHDVRLYAQDLDKALGLPSGNKIENNVSIPDWIFRRQKYIKKCIKGLFETDGDYGRNKKFSVEYIEFSNRSESLRKSVVKALTFLGYSPQMGNRYVRLARKDQVRKFIADIGFERPFPSLKISRE